MLNYRSKNKFFRKKVNVITQMSCKHRFNEQRKCIVSNQCHLRQYLKRMELEGNKLNRTTPDSYYLLKCDIGFREILYVNIY